MQAASRPPGWHMWPARAGARKAHGGRSFPHRPASPAEPPSRPFMWRFDARYYSQVPKTAAWCTKVLSNIYHRSRSTARRRHSGLRGAFPPPHREQFPVSTTGRTAPGLTHSWSRSHCSSASSADSVGTSSAFSVRVVIARRSRSVTAWSEMSNASARSLVDIRRGIS